MKTKIVLFIINWIVVYMLVMASVIITLLVMSFLSSHWIFADLDMFILIYCLVVSLGFSIYRPCFKKGDF